MTPTAPGRTKNCCLCRQRKSYEAFDESSSKDGLAAFCKPCRSRARAAYQESNRGRANALRASLLELGADKTMLGLIRVNDPRALSMLEALAETAGITIAPAPEDLERQACLDAYKAHLRVTVGEGCAVQIEAKDLYSVTGPNGYAKLMTLDAMRRVTA